MAYVATIYRGSVVSGESRPDGDEVTAAEWFAVDALPAIRLSNFATQLFRYLDWI